MYTNIKLPYADSFIKVRLPTRNIAGILKAKHVAGLADETAEIRHALRQPVDMPALADCIHSNDKVMIIATDNTRACPDERLIPVILEELARKVPNANITIMIALGLHAPLTHEQMVQKLGQSVVENYRVVNHDPQQTVFLGTTSFGTPVEINSAVVAADFRISTGFIEPHFFAGFSGGRKSISPGVSSARTIRHNHCYEMIANPKARAGILVGNPIHEDMLEQAKMGKLDFILNVVMNSEKQITHVLAGNPWSAHALACQIESDIVKAEIDDYADITVVTNGGAPLDLDFYQTVKGIDTASKITRPGGVIIAASSCRSGLGPSVFRDLHCACGNADEVLGRIKSGNREGVDWQNQVLAGAQLEHTIYLVSDLPESQVRGMMVNPVRSVEEGLEAAFRLLGSDARIVVVPDGPLVLPVVKEFRNL